MAEVEVVLAQQTPRSIRLALSEVNEKTSDDTTPNKSASPDEILIEQRGPRRKPLTWSPIDYDRFNILGPSRDKTPEHSIDVERKPDINPRLRRRLVLSPAKGTSHDLGLVIARKLRSLNGLN